MAAKKKPNPFAKGKMAKPFGGKESKKEEKMEMEMAKGKKKKC